MCMYMYPSLTLYPTTIFCINIRHLFQSSNRTRFHVHLYLPSYLVSNYNLYSCLSPRHLSSTTFILSGAIQSLPANVKW
jgi:hypothetical protein